MLSLFFVISGCSNSTSHGKSIQPFYEKEGKIYYDNREVVGADPNSFEVYKDIRCYAGVNCFAHDKNSVFYFWTKIQRAEPDGFKFLENGYKKDKNHAYYDGRLIPEADSSSFVLIIGSEKYDAQDKNYQYKEGEIIKD